MRSSRCGCRCSSGVLCPRTRLSTSSHRGKVPLINFGTAFRLQVSWLAACTLPPGKLFNEIVLRTGTKRGEQRTTVLRARGTSTPVGDVACALRAMRFVNAILTAALLRLGFHMAILPSTRSRHDGAGALAATPVFPRGSRINPNAVEAAPAAPSLFVTFCGEIRSPTTREAFSGNAASAGGNCCGTAPHPEAFLCSSLSLDRRGSCPPADRSAPSGVLVRRLGCLIAPAGSAPKRPSRWCTRARRYSERPTGRCRHRPAAAFS
jgi:hypothetical protein